MLTTSPNFVRTYLSYVVLIVLSMFTLVLFLAGQVQKNEMEVIDTNLYAQTELLALSVVQPVRNLDYAAIRSSVRRFGDVADSRFTVIDANGVVLADSHESPFQMENHLNRPEIQEALFKGRGQSLRYSQSLNQEFRYFALPVYSEEGLIAVVRTAYSFSAISERIERQQALMLEYAAGIVFVSLLFAYYLSARQAKVVTNITDVAELIAAGDFERRVKVSKVAGLEKLSGVINQLARNSAEEVALLTADRNRLAGIFSGLVEGVIDVDQNQNIIHVNETAAKMLGLSQLNCIGHLVWEEIHDNKIIQAIDHAIKTQSIVKTQTTLGQPNAGTNAVSELDIYAASLSDDSGNPIGAVVVLHDVTELKNLEKVRTDFVANASHELKTPITAIRGLSETILDDPSADQETSRRFMERIHAQSLRLSNLVGDLITISRSESSQFDSDFVRVDMRMLIKQGVEIAQPSSSEKRQIINVSLPDEKIEVFGSVSSLSQLIDNLINNAIKYTPAEGEIRLVGYTVGNEFVFEVSDSGIGISAQHINRIFERFYRVDKARSQSLGGTGLGLSIVKNIAEKHKGSVTVASQLGHGSTFTFRMSLAVK